MRTYSGLEADRRFDFAVLAVGVVAVSTAALFIREAEAPSMVIAASRMVLASVPLVAWSGARQAGRSSRAGEQSSREQLDGPGEGKRADGPFDSAQDKQTGKEPEGTGAGGNRAGWPSGRVGQTVLIIASGVFLALHFGFWVASVKQTSVVTSVVLVTSQPLLVAVAAKPLLGENTSRAAWIGIAIAIAGAMVMVADDSGRGSSTLLGDAYAMLGAVFAAAYLLAGRSLRMAGVGWLPYATWVYSVAAVLLVGAAVVAGESFGGYSGRTYGFFVLLALVPQLIGHTALNRSLGYLPAASVTIAVLGEPVGATVLAALFLSETPTALQSVGALLVLAGVWAGLRGEPHP